MVSFYRSSSIQETPGAPFYRLNRGISPQNQLITGYEIACWAHANFGVGLSGFMQG